MLSRTTNDNEEHDNADDEDEGGKYKTGIITFF